MTRVLITSDLLLKKFGHLPPVILLAVLSPFAADTDEEALQRFDSIISDFKNQPNDPGKAGSIEAFEDLKKAYLKMSPFERAGVRSNLVLKIADLFSCL